MADIVSAKNDAVFKQLFVRNQKLLKYFIADILDIPVDTITELKVTNPELPPADTAGKMCRLDINLTTDGLAIDIEMQSAKDDDFAERTLFYWAKLYTDSIDRGEMYSAAAKTVSINILGYRKFECDGYHSLFHIMEKSRHELLTDRMEIHFFELTKLDKLTGNIDMTRRREAWLHLIDAKDEKELEMLKNTDIPMIREGVDAIYELSADEQFRAYLRDRERADLDWKSRVFHAEKRGMAKGIAKGRAEGRAEGIAKGKAEGENNVIAKMKMAGLSDEQIRSILNMPDP